MHVCVLLAQHCPLASAAPLSALGSPLPSHVAQRAVHRGPAMLGRRLHKQYCLSSLNLPIWSGNNFRRGYRGNSMSVADGIIT